VSHYRQLAAWQRCHELVLAVYAATRGYPTDERYGLVSQTRRAAVSAAANIVEGSAKRGGLEFRRFLGISLGSLAELSYLLIVAQDLGLLGPPQFSRLETLRNRAGFLTWRLYRSLTPSASPNAKTDGVRTPPVSDRP